MSDLARADKRAYIVRVQRGSVERFQLWEKGSPDGILASLPVSLDPQHDVRLLSRAAEDRGYALELTAEGYAEPASGSE